MSLEIIGAGIAGLLAGKLLRHLDPTIIERQAALPNNHSAVLRFRTSLIGDATNIPFRKVTLTRGIAPWRNPVADALSYSFKCTGSYRSDRSIGGGTESAERYVAPPDLIARLSERSRIELGRSLYMGYTEKRMTNFAPRISTIPMPDLMKILGYEFDDDIFSSVPGVNIRAKIDDTNAYISLLVPNPHLQFSRISITGDELIIEVPGINDPKEIVDMGFHRTEDMICEAAELLGIDEDKIGSPYVTRQAYFKILPIDETERRRFMHWATDKFNIFSLGRYATWRPSLLLDDLVKDIRLIEGWISKQDRYEIARHR